MAKARIRRLQLVLERKLYKLLPMCSPDSHLEASGMGVAGRHILVVFGNFGQIARIPFRAASLALGPSGFFGPPGTAGFEDITCNPKGQLFLLRETDVVKGKEGCVSEVVEWNERFEHLGRSSLDVRFENANRGFGKLAWTQRCGRPSLLVLWEGNHCKNGKNGHTPGGRIQVLSREGAYWVWSRELALPRTLPFKDYAAIGLENDLVGIASQASSMLWVNRLQPGRWEWAGPGDLYEFPRNKKGKRLYFNVEGLAWLGQRQIAVVSDRRKRSEPRRARRKDQSIHIFKLP